MTSDVENPVPLQEEIKPILKALRTCRGQLDGIIGMVEKTRDSLEVSNQILAAQAMLKRANKMVLIQYIEETMRAAMAEPQKTDAAVAEINTILDKLLRQP